ncbi:transposase, partial [Komagataeibacter oboediens]|uniref:transposase n=1 Tax=Komagataeibacter oboediens TaxID=65958 RepID=UPI0020C43374
CSAGAYEFPASCGRRVVARFDGGRMSSDGGVILVKQADDILGLSRRFAACFRDKRHPGFVEYRVEDLVRESVLKSVYLTWPTVVQLLKRRSARRTLWRTGCGLQTIPEHSA